MIPARAPITCKVSCACYGRHHDHRTTAASTGRMYIRTLPITVHHRPPHPHHSSCRDHKIMDTYTHTTCLCNGMQIHMHMLYLYACMLQHTTLSAFCTLYCFSAFCCLRPFCHIHTARACGCGDKRMYTRIYVLSNFTFFRFIALRCRCVAPL